MEHNLEEQEFQEQQIKVGDISQENNKDIPQLEKQMQQNLNEQDTQFLDDLQNVQLEDKKSSGDNISKRSSLAVTLKDKSKNQKRQQDIENEDRMDQDFYDSQNQLNFMMNQNAIHLDFDAVNLQNLRVDFNQNYEMLSQTGNQELLEDLENQINDIEIQSIDLLSQPGSMKFSEQDCDSLSNISLQSDISQVLKQNSSAKPKFYIPQAVKEKLEALIFDFHKDLAVLNHQKLVFMWMAVRMYEDGHQKFWKNLKQSYSKHVIMKRYCDDWSFYQDLENKYKLNPIILMISGYCGESVVPLVYNKYRFKGIIVYTDQEGMQYNRDWVKKYPRIVMLTPEEKRAQEMLHKLIHNTLFRGACKFKDLDHFLGKKKTVASYFLKDTKYLQQQRVQKKIQKKMDQKELLAIKEKNKEQEDNEDENEKNDIENEKYYDTNVPNLSELEYERRLRFNQSRQFLTKIREIAKNKDEDINNISQDQIFQQQENELDQSLFIIENFDQLSDKKQHYWDILKQCKETIKQKNVLIRMDMLEDNVLEKLAEGFASCVQKYNGDNHDETVREILKFYTEKNNEFYAIINCALNTLNESLIYELQDMIKSVRYCLREFDDEDSLFQPGEIVHLWRGCTFDKEHFRNFFKKKQHMVFPAFTSTSTDEDECLKFAKQGTEKRIVFRIECVCDEQFMKNRPKNLKDISAYPCEKEYLFGCFCLLYIEDIVEDYKDDGTGGYLLYKLKVLQ